MSASFDRWRPASSSRPSALFAAEAAPEAAVATTAWLSRTAAVTTNISTTAAATFARHRADRHNEQAWHQGRRQSRHLCTSLAVLLWPPRLAKAPRDQHIPPSVAESPRFSLNGNRGFAAPLLPRHPPRTQTTRNPRNPKRSNKWSGNSQNRR